MTSSPLTNPGNYKKKTLRKRHQYPCLYGLFVLPQGQLYNCIVQLKSKNIKTPLSNDVSFLVFILFYFRSILIILLCIKR